MFVIRSEEERLASRQNFLDGLKAEIEDPSTSALVRQENAEIISNIVQDQQVEALFKAFKECSNPKVIGSGEPLIKIFMVEHGQMLHKQKQPYEIGTSADFFKWINDQPQFS